MPAPTTRGGIPDNQPEPGADPEAERLRIEREVYERRTFKDREAEAHWEDHIPQPLGSAGGQDLNMDLLRSDDPGAAGAEGAGATLGDDRNRPLGAETPEGLAGLNEQQGARLAHGRAQQGQAAAPDQTRGQGRAGSISETEGS
jgi:hypothetical protein